MLTDREFEEEDLGFMEQLAAAHPVWKAEEFGTKNAAEFMLAYSMYNGTWLVWELDGTPAAVSFHLEWAPSNGKPWLGTVAVAPEAKEKGIGRAVIEEIAGRLRAEHKAMFTANIRKPHFCQKSVNAHRSLSVSQPLQANWALVTQCATRADLPLSFIQKTETTTSSETIRQYSSSVMPSSSLTLSIHKKEIREHI